MWIAVSDDPWWFPFWVASPRTWHASPLVESPYALVGLLVALVGLVAFLGLVWVRSKARERDLLRKYGSGHRRAK